MNDSQLTTLVHIKRFLDGTLACDFTVKTTAESYEWVEAVVIRFGYHKRTKKDKSLIKNFIQKVTGYSRAQITRLIKAQKSTGKVARKRYVRHVFSAKYSRADIALLAATEALHDTPNGRATKYILERQWKVYGKPEFKHLSTISVAHIYNVRKTFSYRHINLTYQKTKPTTTPIGERRKPEPNGLPGFL